MLAALLDDKPGFVELFLQNGLSMMEFLTPQILCQLYAGVSKWRLPHDDFDFEYDIWI